MIPEIIQSMKDSPDEMNRKRYEIFKEQQGYIGRLEAELEAIRAVLGLSGVESRPLFLYVADLVESHEELTRMHRSYPSPDNSHLYPSDHYGL